MILRIMNFACLNPQKPVLCRVSYGVYIAWKSPDSPRGINEIKFLTALKHKNHPILFTCSFSCHCSRFIAPMTSSGAIEYEWQFPLKTFKLFIRFFAASCCPLRENQFFSELIQTITIYWVKDGNGGSSWVIALRSRLMLKPRNNEKQIKQDGKLASLARHFLNCRITYVSPILTLDSMVVLVWWSKTG
jgi:hypothetical protein